MDVFVSQSVHCARVDINISPAQKPAFCDQIKLILLMSVGSIATPSRSATAITSYFVGENTEAEEGTAELVNCKVPPKSCTEGLLVCRGMVKSKERVSSFLISKPSSLVKPRSFFSSRCCPLKSLTYISTSATRMDLTFWSLFAFKVTLPEISSMVFEN